MHMPLFGRKMEGYHIILLMDLLTQCTKDRMITSNSRSHVISSEFGEKNTNGETQRDTKKMKPKMKSDCILFFTKTGQNTGIA